MPQRYIYKGIFVKYHGHEYQVTNYGHWGVRIERGYGSEHSVLVVDWRELEAA